jgi:cell division protein FtsL
MNLLIWAIFTIAITGTVWIAIPILGMKRRESALLEELHDAHQQIAELEEKLDLAERQLLQSRPEERLPLRP